MITRDDRVCAVGLQGAVAVIRSAPIPLDALLAGTEQAVSWDNYLAACPMRFEAGPIAGDCPSSEQAIVRDFGDSYSTCSSNGPCTVNLSRKSRPWQERGRVIPAAIGFAFAQQWARIGHAFFHGALLRVRGEGVLVVGVRASGKSVLSASALAAGGGIITDDFLLLGVKDEVLVGERIRQFLALRRSWAADALVEGFSEVWQPDRSGRRVFLSVSRDDERFPEFSRIDRIWVLKRPRAGRRVHSSLDRVSNAEVYASLVSAIQPLLLGVDFPHERNKLQALFAKLVSSVPTARIETGQDIVLEPKRTWDRLLAWSP